MSLIDLAAPAAPLSLRTSPALFVLRDNAKNPCAVSLPGSSNLDLQLFNVTATGSAKPSTPGTLILTLYGMAKPSYDPQNATDPSAWLPISSTPPEPIGGPEDPEEAMWMLQGADLMVFVASGKMQGTFKSNVASNPQLPVVLEEHPRDIENTDPLYIFAVGASFMPTSGRVRIRQGQDEPDPLCELKLEALSIEGNG
jgi:hypothetical protein